MEKDIIKDTKTPADAESSGVAKKESNELEECEKKCDEYLNNWKRAQADFENYKKEEIDRMAMLGTYARESMIFKVLPIFDSFYLAKKHSDILQNVGVSEWRKGFEQIKQQIEEFLKKEGVEEITAVGQKFDPHTMEIVEECEVSDTSHSGIVIEELQKGYMMHEKILRPAKVRIKK